MAKTLLELTNKVLIRLREPTVASASSTAYSSMIAEFVRQATREVEQAHNWVQLRQTIQVPVVGNTINYVLTGAGTDFRVLGVYEDTTDYRLSPAPSYRQMNEWLLQNNRSIGPPEYWDINGTSGGDPIVNFYPEPDVAYSVNFNMVIVSQLDNDTDFTPTPELPIVLRAVFLAIEERGDDGGNSLPILDAQFTNALASAVAIDAALYEDESVWYEE
jgi:hypothetical protein